MIIYEGIKEEFVNDIESGVLVNKLYENFKSKIGRTSPGEVRSWQNSMQYMYMALNDKDIPLDVGIAIEYKIPASSKRIDFILTGTSELNKEAAVIIELKQWSKVEKVSGKDGVVKTLMNQRFVETTHPSYQAWSYAALISDYNEYVQQENIQMKPCVYMHNYRLCERDPILDNHYRTYIDRAPIFTLTEVEKLRSFIKRYIRHGDNKEVLYRIENGRIRPSKSLQDVLGSMLAGNEEFIMVDEQKIAYENAIQLARASWSDNKKRVLIVKGGPGTGKSVLAINLLVAFTQEEMVCQYVTKNSAPRHVYAAKLKGNMKRCSINNLFKSSGVFVDARLNELDAIIVDEAHRLNEKSGMYRKGEHQIKEIIHASRFSIFFLDENQRVHMDDVGSIESVKTFALKQKAQVFEMELSSQFRCNGSDGYLAWIDDVLGIRETGNVDGFDMDYDLQVMDNPNDMKDLIYEKNKINNKARMLAGYCWEWKKESRSNSLEHNIIIPDHLFKMSWNLDNSQTFAIDETSVHEVGCIHTSQGLEFDYVGVIIGEDLRYESGRIVTDFTKRAKTDQSLKGIKKLYAREPQKALKLADEIIKNTYRTLMTRGQKGCYIFCVDPGLQSYMKHRLAIIRAQNKCYISNTWSQSSLVAEEKESY